MSRTVRQEDGVPDLFTGRVDYTKKDGEESHYYLLDGESVDGVTSITHGGTPTPPALQRWKDRMGPKRGDRILSDAAARGTQVHEWAEEFAMTGALPSEVPEHLTGRAAALEGFLSTWKPRFLLVEKVVFNPFHLYAGTLDAIAHVEGLGNTLLDYKTAKRVYPEHALQLSAYRYASFWIAEDEETRIALPRIDACAVALLNDDGSFSLTPVQADRVIFGVFLKAKAMYDFSRRGAMVVGQPLRPFEAATGEVTLGGQSTPAERSDS